MDDAREFVVDGVREGDPLGIRMGKEKNRIFQLNFVDVTSTVAAGMRFVTIPTLSIWNSVLCPQSIAGHKRYEQEEGFGC